MAARHGETGLVSIAMMGHRCLRCGHEWVPFKSSVEQPRVCPRCKSPYWNKARKEKKGES